MVECSEWEGSAALDYKGNLLRCLAMNVDLQRVDLLDFAQSASSASVQRGLIDLLPRKLNYTEVSHPWSGATLSNTGQR